MLRRSVGTAVMSLPPYLTVPTPAPSSPASARSVSDLPEPEGPTIASRLLLAVCAACNLNPPAVAPISKLTAAGAVGTGGSGVGDSRRRGWGKRWIVLREMAIAATAKASTVGATACDSGADENRLST